jgi:two-component system NtrC family sensor kinase
MMRWSWSPDTSDESVNAPPPDYISAIEAHLEDENEASLSRAYDLGRMALGAGLGILDVLTMHDAAQQRLLLSAPESERPRIAAAIASFFREFLSPFEMRFRGYREANGELTRLNENLASAYGELQAKQSQLIQAAKMASLGELVAGIAHEVNNPLAFVASHLTTVRKSVERIEGELDEAAPAAVRVHCERARSRLDESQLGVERIRKLVLRLRTFSRLDEGEEDRVSMRECITSVLAILEHRFRGRIRVETRFGEPDIVDCYPSLLNQAIMNLVSNAVEAIPDQGVITITTGGDAADYVIIVTDTGQGIPEHLRQRVLDPFFTTKPIGQGTGLGLSITHSIVQTHRGTLELSPAEGGGTAATIRFPIKQPEIE